MSYGDTELHTGIKMFKNEKQANLDQLKLPMPLYENRSSFILSMDDDYSPVESAMNQTTNNIFNPLNDDSSDDQ